MNMKVLKVLFPVMCFGIVSLFGVSCSKKNVVDTFPQLLTVKPALPFQGFFSVQAPVGSFVIPGLEVLGAFAGSIFNGQSNDAQIQLDFIYGGGANQLVTHVIDSASIDSKYSAFTIESIERLTINGSQAVIIKYTDGTDIFMDLYVFNPSLVTANAVIKTSSNKPLNNADKQNTVRKLFTSFKFQK